MLIGVTSGLRFTKFPCQCLGYTIEETCAAVAPTLQRPNYTSYCGYLHLLALVGICDKQVASVASELVQRVFYSQKSITITEYTELMQLLSHILSCVRQHKASGR